MTLLIYFVSGLLFSMGLAVSGMIQPEVVKSFLNLNPNTWSPGLLFVLSVAVIVYGAVFLWLKNRGRSANGAKFGHPAPRPIDSRLVIGAMIFGLGWGLTGLCPGPALASLGSAEPKLLVFLATMVLGFELQRKFT
jgi:uncharacterized membrane protein YedE/YeeE